MAFQSTTNTYGLLAKGVVTTANTDVKAYTLPTGVSFLNTEIKCLNIASIPVTINIASSSDTVVGGQDYLEYKVELGPGAVLSRQCELMSPGESLWIKASVADAVVTRVTGLKGTSLKPASSATTDIVAVGTTVPLPVVTPSGTGGGTGTTTGGGTVPNAVASYVAVTSASGSEAYWSTDGINWTIGNIRTPTYSFSQLYAVAYGNGVWVAAPDNGDPFFGYSTNGINWERTAVPSSAPIWSDISYGGGLFIAVSMVPSNPINRENYLYSTNGVKWLSGSKMLDKAAYGNGVWVGLSGLTALYSNNGIDWISAPNYPAMTTNSLISSIASDGAGNWLGVGLNTGRTIKSVDGVNWSEGSKIPLVVAGQTDPGEWVDLAYGNGVWIAIPKGDLGNKVAYSSDGVTWLFSNLPGTLHRYVWNSIAFGSGKFIAVGSGVTQNGIIAMSTNGVTWSQYIEPYGVTPANSTFISVAAK